MKTLWTILFGLFISVGFTEAQDTLYVYKVGAVAYKSAINSIDSVTFEKVYTVDAIKDIDGNVYTSVTIGTQTWLVENLKTTHYRNGDAIANITDNSAWGALSTGAWCDFSNLSANGNIYGHLYNWYAVNDSRKIAPVGWHIPSESELTTLTDFLGGESVAGGKLKNTGTTNWLSPNTGATNASGFSALPGGYRGDNGSFNDLGSMFSIWSSTESSASNGWGRLLVSSGGQVLHENWTKNLGFSVRCLQNYAPILTTTVVSGITTTTASTGGNVTADGGETLTACGVCWDTNPAPTISLNTKTIQTGATGAFVSEMTDLTPSTKYYIRAYATSALGTSYGDEVSFTTKGETGTLTDIDGNVYATVKIGTQTWMAENLRTTKYRDGSEIIFTSYINNIPSFPQKGWYVYDNLASNATKYGCLYKWDAVNDSRKIAPVGWHVATDAEWTTLENYVAANKGYSPNAVKALAASTDWTLHNNTGTIGSNLNLNNSSGLSLIPGGYGNTVGSFYSKDYQGYWWTATEANAAGNIWYRQISYNGNYINRNVFPKALCLSVRCIKDEVPTLSDTDAALVTGTTTAVSGGNVINDGGVTITQRGICWSTSTSPTTSLSTKTTESGTIGAFKSVMTGLTANTKYYVRAYATNSCGTAYGTEISFTTPEVMDGIVDIDGNVYTSVTIGTQTWMVENLKTTHYRDGSAIESKGLPQSGAWVDYDNSAEYGAKWGHLYNWYAVNDSRKLAPEGWHVATAAEWTTLINYVTANPGVSLNAVKALAANIDWNVTSGGVGGTVGDNLAINNSSGFSALPGGFYNTLTYEQTGGVFQQGFVAGNWTCFIWTGTEYSVANGNMISIIGTQNYILNGGSNTKANYMSVRCIKD